MIYFTILKSNFSYSYDLYIVKFGSAHSFSDCWPLIITPSVSYTNILEHMISGKVRGRPESLIKSGGFRSLAGCDAA